MSAARKLPTSVAAKSAIIDSDFLIELRNRGIEEALSVLYSTVYIPGAVKKEQKKHRARSRVNRLLRGKLFRRCSVEDKVAVELLSYENLGAGEAQAIIQAREKGIEVILTNDGKAKKFAKRHGLKAVQIGDIEESLSLYRKR